MGPSPAPTRPARPTPTPTTLGLALARLALAGLALTGLTLTLTLTLTPRPALAAGATSCSNTTIATDVVVQGGLTVQGAATLSGGLFTTSLNGAPLLCGVQWRAKTQTNIPALQWVPLIWDTANAGMLETFGTSFPTVYGDTSGSNYGVILINVAGVCTLNGQWVTSGFNGATQYYNLGLFKNGAQIAALAAQPNNGPSNNVCWQTFSWTGALAAGDKLQVRIYQNQINGMTLPTGGSAVSFAGTTPQTNVNTYSLFRLPG